LAAVVHDAWKKGCVFDGWSDLFRFDLWKQAIAESGLDANSYLGPRNTGDIQPWSHIGPAGAATRLLRDKERADSEAKIGAAAAGPASRGSGGGDVGGPEAADSAAAKGPADDPTSCTSDPDSGRVGDETAAEPASGAPNSLYGRRRKKSRGQQGLTGTGFRLQYAKLDRVRFISHLDVVRVFDRALRKAGLPIAFSQGFAKHPKIAFGPPLPVGVTSRAEYLDLEFSAPVTTAFVEALDAALPEGLSALAAEPHKGSKPASLMSCISQADYRIWLSPHSAGEVERTRGAGAVDAAFLNAGRLLEGCGRSRIDGPSWLEAVMTGRVDSGENGPEITARVRLDIKKGPKIWEIGAGLLEELDLDPRLIRFERMASWVLVGPDPVSPLEM
jgi:hypothetical protein